VFPSSYKDPPTTSDTPDPKLYIDCIGCNRTAFKTLVPNDDIPLDALRPPCSAPNGD